MPQDWGRATPRAKVMVAAASIALPPASSVARPASEAAVDSEATTPPLLRTASSYREPSTAAAPPAITSISSIVVAAARALRIVPTSPRFLSANTTPTLLFGARSLVTRPRLRTLPSSGRSIEYGGESGRDRQVAHRWGGCAAGARRHLPVAEQVRVR